MHENIARERPLDVQADVRSLVSVVLLTFTLLAAPACGRSAPAARRAGSVEQPRSCGERIPLVPGASTRASTRFGADKLRASCLRGDASECVFSLDVPERSELRVALESNDFDGALALYNDAPTPSELRCVDDTPSGDLHHARLDLAVAPGRYLVVVDGASGEAGDFELFVELEPLPNVGEICARARALSPGVTLRDSTRGGVHLFSATCGGGAQGPEHVHKLLVEQPSRLRIRQRAEYDGSLYVRAACEDASTEVACNDDYQTSGSSLLAARVAPGTYYVFSDSYSRDHSGDYTLAVELEAEPATKSSATICADAEQAPALTPGLIEIDTFYGSSALSGSCGGEGAPELVLPIRVDVPSTLVALLDEAESNAVMYVRRVCADPQSELACYVAPRIDRTPSERDSSPNALVTSLERGSYVLVIDGYEANELGAATLRLLLTPRT